VGPNFFLITDTLQILEEKDLNGSEPKISIFLPSTQMQPSSKSQTQQLFAKPKFIQNRTKQTEIKLARFFPPKIRGCDEYKVARSRDVPSVKTIKGWMQKCEDRKREFSKVLTSLLARDWDATVLHYATRTNEIGLSEFSRLTKKHRISLFHHGNDFYDFYDQH
jgi:hypothetical protein